jgi:nitronate monooxygenase
VDECQECGDREALASPGAKHTAPTNVFTGRPARGIVNRLIAELGPIPLKDS